MDYQKLLDERLSKLTQLSEASKNLSTQLSAIEVEALKLQGEVRLLRVLQGDLKSEPKISPDTSKPASDAK